MEHCAIACQRDFTSALSDLRHYGISAAIKFKNVHALRRRVGLVESGSIHLFQIEAGLKPLRHTTHDPYHQARSAKHGDAVPPQLAVYRKRFELKTNGLLNETVCGPS